MMTERDSIGTGGCPVTANGTLPRTPVVKNGNGYGDIFGLSRVPILTKGHSADRRLPGPVGAPLVGVAPQFMHDPFAYMVRCQQKYGDIFRLPLPLWATVAVAHPDLITEVLHDRGQRFGMPTIPDSIGKRFGVPFPILDGKPYAARRNIITPMFGKRFLDKLAEEQIFPEFDRRLQEWDRFADTGEIIDLEHELARITLPGFLRAMFTMTITDDQFVQYDRDLRKWLATAATALWMRPGYDLLPIPGVPHAVTSVRRIYRTVGEILDDRLANPVDRHDLLQVLVDARLPDGTAVPRKDLVHDTVGIMAAGYETVVAALCWTLALLPTNADAEEKLSSEIDVLNGARPTPHQVNEMSWARACFDEGQRLQGHPFIFRFAKADTELAGFHVPKGTMIAGCMTAVHRDPRWWENPQQFDPTHFTDAEQVARRPKGAFIPFGTGPHQCVGMAMAYMNAVYLMTAILQRYEIHQRPGWEPQHKASTSTTIKGGFPVTLSHR